MAYATPAELRAHYATSDVDELAHLSDAALTRHLERASAAIDRYRPGGTLTAEVLALLTPVCLAIARAYAHDEHALSENHPVRRDYEESMRWLRDWARGAVGGAAAASGGVSALSLFTVPLERA